MSVIEAEGGDGALRKFHITVRDMDVWSFDKPMRAMFGPEKGIGEMWNEYQQYLQDQFPQACRAARMGICRPDIIGTRLLGASFRMVCCRSRLVPVAFVLCRDAPLCCASVPCRRIAPLCRAGAMLLYSRFSGRSGSLVAGFLLCPCSVMPVPPYPRPLHCPESLRPRYPASGRAGRAGAG